MGEKSIRKEGPGENNSITKINITSITTYEEGGSVCARVCEFR